MSGIASSEHLAIAKQHGGVLQRADCHPAMWDNCVTAIYRLHEGARSTAVALCMPRWKDRPVHMSVVDCGEVNACAVPGREADYILIYRGLIERVLGYSLALFATREFLPNVFGKSRERSLQETAPFFGQSTNLRTAHTPRVAFDADRSWCALTSAVFSLHIVLAHEYGHILGGHFSLLTGGASAGYNELFAQQGKVSASVPLACLEWDADRYAAFTCSYLQRYAPIPPLLAAVYGSTIEERFVFAAIFGVSAHVLFRCLTTQALSSYALDPNRYPPPSLRGSAIVWNMLNTVQDEKPVNFEKRDAVLNLISQIERIMLRTEDEALGVSWYSNFETNYHTMAGYLDRYRTRFVQSQRTRITWHKSGLG